MKKILQIILIIILFTVSGLMFWAKFSPKTFEDFVMPYSETLDLPYAISSEPVLGIKGQININGSVWNVDIAKTETDRVSGLSNKKILHNKTGLLFAFDKLGNQSFWMKDMLIPIDMIFFDSDWKIVLIESNLQPNSFPKIFGRSVKSQYVLEINANEANTYGLQAGNQAIFMNK
jgi:uncharacterized membrane protein (UPF0127 family)